MYAPSGNNAQACPARRQPSGGCGPGSRRILWTGKPGVALQVRDSARLTSKSLSEPATLLQLSTQIVVMPFFGSHPFCERRATEVQQEIFLHLALISVELASGPGS